MEELAAGLTQLRLSSSPEGVFSSGFPHPLSTNYDNEAWIRRRLIDLKESIFCALAIALAMMRGSWNVIWAGSESYTAWRPEKQSLHSMLESSAKRSFETAGFLTTSEQRRSAVALRIHLQRGTFGFSVHGLEILIEKFLRSAAAIQESEDVIFLGLTAHPSYRHRYKLEGLKAIAHSLGYGIFVDECFIRRRGELEAQLRDLKGRELELTLVTEAMYRKQRGGASSSNFQKSASCQEIGRYPYE
ncbi:hypothetical protein B0H19DRAFT_1074488 [Mycena capillaripes]|nr:hypothetical protein B0H19DRAFT_1074488 [Mycena capillaripes]